MNELKLGDKVTDKVTEYSGKIVGLATYLTASSTALVASKNSNGTIVEQWIDIGRLIPAVDPS